MSASRLLLVIALASVVPARAQAPEQWVEWGDRLHGGFGSLIALGIRVGNDALERLNAERRQVTVTYADGPKTPCPCMADGIALAVSASPGQRTLAMAAAPAAPELYARVVFTHKSSGRTLTYEVPMSVLPAMQAINREKVGVARYEAVMKLEPATLFRVAP